MLLGICDHNIILSFFRNEKIVLKRRGLYMKQEIAGHQEN